MDERHQERHSATKEPWDGLTREPLPADPRSPWSSWALPQATSTRMLLGALALLLVVTLVGTTALVLRDLRMQLSQTTTRRLSVSATATVAPTPTTPPYSPQDDGWTAFTPAVWGGDVRFSQSSPQRGYLCGQGPNDRIFAVTADGGQTWQVSPSPAQYSGCSLQVAAINSLDVAVTSYVDGAGQFISVDAHYSVDGGKTWKVAPIPQDTQIPGGATWSGPYLYVWSGTSQYGPQPNSLQVSANGGPFTSIDLSRLVPGVQNIAIQSVIGTSHHLYLNLGYTGCSAQNCQAIVASGDSGKTWAQVPNQSSIQLVYVVGNTLYGQMTAGATTTIVLSRDNGASWTPVTFPPLPSGQTWAPDTPRSWLPATDGTVFVASGVGVAYLRFGGWTIIGGFFGTIAAVSLGANGHPQRVWLVDDGNDYLAGIYWHALP